jgi:hypothetical protein
MSQARRDGWVVDVPRPEWQEGVVPLPRATLARPPRVRQIGTFGAGKQIGAKMLASSNDRLTQPPKAAFGVSASRFLLSMQLSLL